MYNRYLFLDLRLASSSYSGKPSFSTTSTYIDCPHLYKFLTRSLLYVLFELYPNGPFYQSFLSHIRRQDAILNRHFTYHTKESTHDVEAIRLTRTSCNRVCRGANSCYLAYQTFSSPRSINITLQAHPPTNARRERSPLFQTLTMLKIYRLHKYKSLAKTRRAIDHHFKLTGMAKSVC